MTLRTRALATLLLALPLAAVAQRPSTDPANLKGERVVPLSLADNLDINHGAPALQQLLLKLRTRASLMLIVAHPDDEDGGMLTYESRGQGARVAMLTLTRGEGGQNLMSADFNDALGLIRTQELLAADRYMGVDQFFGTEVDFGFSKTKEETLAQWTHDRVLYDAVRAVRLYRPLVLASVFVGGPTDGHGHHQVSGEITQEVFLAAADPKVFPEMGLPPWAPLKVYARVPFSRVSAEGMFDYATGKTVPTRFHNYVTNQDSSNVPEPTVSIHEGEQSNMLGMEGLSYVQFARKGLALQKTQIGEGVRLAPAGTFDSGYTLMANRIHATPAHEESLFDSIDVSLPAIALLAPDAPATLRSTLLTIDNEIGKAQQLFTPERPELAAPPLRDALRSLDALIHDTDAQKLPEEQAFNVLHELRTKRVQLNDALALAHHLSLTATLVAPKAEPNLLSTLSSLSVSLHVDNQSANSFRVAGVQVTVNLLGQGIMDRPGDHKGAGDTQLQPRSSEDYPLRLPYLRGLPATRPYFSRPNLDQPFYNVADPNLRNAPATPAPIVAGVMLDDQGVMIELESMVPAPLQPEIKPELAARLVPQPLVVAPPITVSLPLPGGILALGDGESKPSFTLPVTLNVHAAEPSTCPPAGGVPQHAKLALSLPPGWATKPDDEGFDPRCAVSKTVLFTVLPVKQPTAGETIDAKAFGRYEARNYLEAFRAVGYPGLTFTNFYAPATFHTSTVDVKTAPGLRIAYLPGTGDDVPAYLPDIGITPTILTIKDLNASTLANFDAVLLGVRAYAAHPELAGEGSKPLLDFAAGGGVVIVQYNSGGSSGKAAPYPFELPGDSAHNVVVETQPVTILSPQNPLLKWPNSLDSHDFDHWSEEWGHGFASSWDPQYETPLEVHDPDQDAQKGGLLIAKTGKGAYIYCAFALYRQFPEGVPGAYRLMANLLSYVKNPSR